MGKLKNLFLDRYRKSAPKIESVFKNNINDITKTPIVILVRYYDSFGSNKDQMPLDYYSSPSSMLRYQEESIMVHLNEIDDDYIPCLVPWFGTGVLASGFGCKVKYPDKPGADPFVKGPCISDKKDINNLKLPDPYKDGFMPRVLENMDYMKKNSEIPVSLTDIQGPLDTLCVMCGYNRLFMWMEDDPKAVHYLFDIVTEALINWIKIQKKITGESNDEINSEQGFWVPRGIGIWMSEDDLVSIGPKQYEEFVMPHHERILKAFNKGVIHFCGNASQHIPLFLSLKNLAVINTATLWDFECVKKLQEKMQNKIVLLVSDIAPLDIEKYYNNLLSKIDLNKIILGLFVKEDVALLERGYIEVDRDDLITAKESLYLIKSKLSEKIKS